MSIKLKLESFLQSFLDSKQIISYQDSNIEPFLKEKRNNFTSQALCVVLPNNAQEASKVITYCNVNNINIVSQSGNTGLTGGSVSNENSIILSSKNLNKVISINKKNMSATVEAGTTLKELQQAALEHGLFFPLSLPSEEQCCIGGNIATNAGGINVIKYGSMANLLMGVEAVLPNGEIYSDLNLLRKRNIGPNLSQLFIGSEGLMGFITKATVKLFPKPKLPIYGIIADNSIEEIQKAFFSLYNTFYMNISSFEIYNLNAKNIVKEFFPQTTSIDKDFNWYAVFTLEFSLDSKAFKKEVENEITNSINFLGSYKISENSHLWDLRYKIPVSQTMWGESLKHDISIPLDKISEYINITSSHQDIIENNLMPVTFGHMGDGNLHFNFSSYDKNSSIINLKEKIKAICVENAMKMQGTFSAEHGIGLLHKKEFKRFYSQNQGYALELIKVAMDKNNIFNRHKIIS